MFDRELEHAVTKPEVGRIDPRGPPDLGCWFNRSFVPSRAEERLAVEAWLPLPAGAPASTRHGAAGGRRGARDVRPICVRAGRRSAPDVAAGGAPRAPGGAARGGDGGGG